MSELKIKQDELVRRAKAYAISKLNLEDVERELKVAQNRVNASREHNKKVHTTLCCSPLQFRTTAILLDHPHEEEKQMVVIVRHEKHDRDGDLWDVQMVEITA